jgi:lysylphosphatidylglycerol synthetase-like protein (DUF2156 family)
MNKKISAIAVLSLVLFSALALGVRAQNVTDALTGLNTSAVGVNAFKDQTKTPADANFLATNAGQVISLVLSFVGVIFLGLMIYAGIMWMTSSGNQEAVTKAKDLITNAIIGIVIVFAAYAITAFLGSQLLLKQ